MATTQLPPEIFDVEPNVPLIHQVVVAQLAAARAGTHKAKTRGEVAGGGRKPYKQKGTGRARQGSIRAPQFAGGGTVHGPVPRDYSQRTPKKMKAAALRGILSDRARADAVDVVASFGDSDVPSTKAALAVLGADAATGRVLVVLSRAEENAWRSLRNVAALHLVASDQLSAYDVVVSDRVVFSQAALDEFVARATGSGPTEDAKLAENEPTSAVIADADGGPSTSSGTADAAAEATPAAAEATPEEQA